MPDDATPSHAVAGCRESVMSGANPPPASRWHREPGARVQGSRPLDSAKVQAPCIIRLPTGGFRLFYTGIGPGKPFRACQGYILSARSDDGLDFHPEPGIRLAPRPGHSHLSLRALAPTVADCGDGRWRMYFEARGPAAQPTAICSAVSDDLLDWRLEDDARLALSGGVGGPRYLPLPGGQGRLYCFESVIGPGGERLAQRIVSAVTSDGLHFELEPGVRLGDRQGPLDSAGITAAEVVAPGTTGSPWTMVYSVWQDVPPGITPPLHPSHDAAAVERGRSDDFAADSIAVDLSGYRSRILLSQSSDPLVWESGSCIVEGGGYDADGLDAVHAEDMSLVELEDGAWRMYYAACDRRGRWCIASARSDVGDGVLEKRAL